MTSDPDPSASALLDQLRAGGSHPIVQGFPGGVIVVFDDSLRYLCAGGHGLGTVGLTRATIEGKTIYEVFPPAVHSVLEEPYRQVFAGREATLEIEFGDRIFLHRIAPLTDAEGVVVAGIGFAHDVTASRQALRELLSSE